MPKYKVDFTVVDTWLGMESEDRIKFIERLSQLCDYIHEKYVIIMLYIYGMRPAELLKIRKANFKLVNDELILRLPTVKEGDPRTILLSVSQTPFLKWVAKYVQSDTELLPDWKDPTNINHIFKKIARKTNREIEICPYVFRKFRLSYLALNLDASPEEIKSWKGAKDYRSVAPYIRMKPITKFSTAIK